MLGEPVRNGPAVVECRRCTVRGVGSRGSKPRRPGQHKLPKVGSPENVDYEMHQKRKEAFGGWPIVLIVAILVLGFFAWIVLTAI